MYGNSKCEWNKGRRGIAPVLGSGKFLFVHQVKLLCMVTLNANGIGVAGASPPSLVLENFYLFIN